MAMYRGTQMCDVPSAIFETLKVLDHSALPPDGEASYGHMCAMYDRVRHGNVTRTYDVGKQNRWLGYIQGVAIAHNALTLEQAKRINRMWGLDG